MAMQEITLGADTEGISFDGPAEITCEVVWTEDARLDGGWHTELFRSFGAARRYASRLERENEGNPHFAFYAKRFVTVSTRDFLDRAKRPAEMRVCDFVYRPEDVAAEVEVDNASSGNTERVYQAEAMACSR